MSVRRIVTGVRNGQSVIVEDCSIQTYAFKNISGATQTNLWGTDAPPENVGQAKEIAINSILPPPEGSRFMIIDIPTDAQAQNTDFDPEAAAQEYRTELGDFADCFDPDSPGMHTTPTLDYGFVISGQPVLELDDGKCVTLNAGDVVVQCSARHAWRNPHADTARMLFVLLGERQNEVPSLLPDNVVS